MYCTLPTVDHGAVGSLLIGSPGANLRQFLNPNFTVLPSIRHTQVQVCLQEKDTKGAKENLKDVQAQTTDVHDPLLG